MLELKAIDTRKNPNFSFSMEVKNGKIDNSLLVHSMGKDLVSVLNGDPATRVFLSDKNVVIEMTRAAMLNIRYN